MLTRIKILTFLVPFLGLLALVSCSDSTSEKVDTSKLTTSTVVGTVNDLPITIEDLIRQYITLNNPGNKLAATPENCWKEATYKVMSDIKARTFKDYDPVEVHRLVKNRLHDVVMGYMFNDLFGKDIEITQAEIESTYDANIDSYTIPERRAVTHLLSSNNPKAWSILEGVPEGTNVNTIDSLARVRAYHLYDLLQKGSDIKVLVKEYSHDTQSKDSGGVVGPFTKDEMVPKFADVAFGMKVGEISKPFRTSYGWHIIRLDSILPGQVQRRIRTTE